MSTVPSIRPSVCFEVQKIIGVSFSNDGTTRNFHIQWAPTWISDAQLVGCEELINKFMITQNHHSCEGDANSGNNDCLLSSSSDDNDAFFPPSNRKYLRKQGDLSSDCEGTVTEHRDVICMDADISDTSEDINPTFSNEQKNPNFEWRDVEEQTDIEENHQITSENDAINYKSTLDIKEEEHGICNADYECEHFDSTSYGDNTDKNIGFSTIESQKITSFTSDINDTSNLEHSGETHYPMWREYTSYRAEDRLHVCKLCHNTYSSRADLARHFNVHTGYKPYQCLECNKFFSRKHHLTDHLRLHTGEKPYMCGYCDKAFTRNHHLKDHIRVHHKEKKKELGNDNI